MSIELMHMLVTLVGLGVAIGAILIATGRIIGRFDAMDKRIDAMDARINKLGEDLSYLRGKIDSFPGISGFSSIIAPEPSSASGVVPEAKVVAAPE